MLTRALAALSRLRFLVSRRRLSDDLGAELESHTEMLAEFMPRPACRGMTRSAARRQLGNTTLVREGVYRMNRPDHCTQASVSLPVVK